MDSVSGFTIALVGPCATACKGPLCTPEPPSIIILCIRSLVEMGCWSDLVRYCAYRIEESMDETLLEEMDEDSAVIH